VLDIRTGIWVLQHGLTLHEGIPEATVLGSQGHVEDVEDGPKTLTPNTPDLIRDLTHA
jgi:hypothetical protein